MLKEKDLIPGYIITMPKPAWWFGTDIRLRPELALEYYPSLLVSVVARHPRRHAKKTAPTDVWEIVILSLGKLKTIEIRPHQFTLWKRIL